MNENFIREAAAVIDYAKKVLRQIFHQFIKKYSFYSAGKKGLCILSVLDKALQKVMLCISSII